MVDRPKDKASSTKSLAPLEDRESANIRNESAGFILPLMAMAGAVCIFLAALWAWQSRQQAQKYRATTEALLTGKTVKRLVDGMSPSTDLGTNQQVTFYLQVDAVYAYQVDGTQYPFQLQETSQPPNSIQVCYDPRNPNDSVLGPLTMSWLPTLLIASLGLFLWFVAYQFR